MSKADWIWMPHPGHLIVSSHCQFHLNTYLGNGFMVSTVGEWWPERAVRDIHAEIHDPEWYAQNRHLKGDYYDHAYMQRFGFEEIGYDRKYETMVFRAQPSPDDVPCCDWQQINGQDQEMRGYQDAGAAYNGHMQMCKKWARKRQWRKA